MKGLFLIDHHIDLSLPTGVDKKIMAQINAFRANGLFCEPFYLKYAAGGENLLHKALTAFIRRLPYSNTNPKWEYNDQFGQADFIYFRKPAYITYGMRMMLKRVKERNPRIKIIMEIPTYPYDAELKLYARDLPFYLKDKFNRQKLEGVIDRISLISDQEHPVVFSIKALRITNGIDLSSISIRKPVINDSIDICAVAKFADWHGYDRVLISLIKYYREGGKRDIVLHMVGEGDELFNLKQIASDDSIKNRVRFYGHLSGRDLDDIYDISDIGMTSFGAYRKGMRTSSELKSREYLAKGLAIISGCPIDIMQGTHSEYFYEYPNDSSLIDVDKIIDLYDTIYRSEHPLRLPRIIRESAEPQIDINKTMNPVIKYLTDG